MLLIRLFLLLILLFLSQTAFSSDAGKIIFSLGKVYVTHDNGDKKRIRRGDTVKSGDTLETGKNGQAQIRFLDGGFISVRPTSKLVIDEFHFENNPEKDKANLSLVVGGFRAITGKIGKKIKRNYKVKTVVATIGIRGTDYSLMMCDGNCKDENSSASENKGLFVGVAKGGVTLTNDAGTMELDKNQYGHIVDSNKPPVTLAKAPSFLMFDKTEATEDDKKKIKNSSNQKPEKNNKKEEKNEGDKKESDAVDRDDKKSVTTKEPDKENETKGLSSKGEVASEENNTVTERIADENASLDKNQTTDSTKGEVNDLRIEQRISEDMHQPSPNDVISLTDVILDREAILGLETLPVEEIPAVKDPGSVYQSIPVVNAESRRLIMSGSNPEIVSGVQTNQTVTPGSFTTIDGLTSVITTDVEGSPEGDLNYRLEGDARTNVNLGYDPHTGLSWGRWTNGAINKHLMNFANAEMTVESLNNNNIHWIVGQINSNVTALPLTGTADYILIGNTQPTDNLGNVGVLGSATLQVNFTNQSVDSTVDLNINQQHWTATGNNLPLLNNGEFGGDLGVTVQGVLPTSITGSGEMQGAIVGSGEIPTGAGVGFNLEASINDVPTSVSGTAIFKAP